MLTRLSGLPKLHTRRKDANGGLSQKQSAPHFVLCGVQVLWARSLLYPVGQPPQSRRRRRDSSPFHGEPVRKSSSPVGKKFVLPPWVNPLSHVASDETAPPSMGSLYADVQVPRFFRISYHGERIFSSVEERIAPAKTDGRRSGSAICIPHLLAICRITHARSPGFARDG